MSRTQLMIAGLCMSLGTSAFAQAPDASLLAKQKEAMKPLQILDGEWVGPAQAHERQGIISMTQTERAGPLLDGTIRLVEGRAFDRMGKTVFNAFAVISYDVPRARYMITSYASGYATTTEIKVRADGFDWEVPAGPGAKMQFSALIKDGSWSEVGDYVTADGKKRRTFEMKVKRRGNSAWPHGTLVPR